MTREETAAMLSLLRVTYPAFYSKMRAGDLNMILDLWAEMFAEEDANIARCALKDLIATHSGFPPDIAAVKARIGAILAVATGEPSDAELWQMLKKAAANGTYNSRDEFEKLPAVLKRYLGDHSELMQLAQIDTDTFNTVTHGQFLKEIKVIRERVNCEERMPEGLRQIIGQSYRQIEADKPMTPDAVNSRRNYLLDAIDAVNVPTEDALNGCERSAI